MSKTARVAADPGPDPEPLEWVDAWMDRQGWDASLMESRTAFVRAMIRTAHVRRPAREWAAAWAAWQTMVPQ